MLASIVRRVAAMQYCSRLGFYKDNRGKGEKNWKETKGGNVVTWSRYNVNEFKSYFDSKVRLIDQESMEIIQSLNNQHTDNAALVARINVYLRANESFNNLPPTSKINILVALQMRSNLTSSELQSIRNTLLQHIIRHQLQDLCLDQRALLILVRNYQRFRHIQHQKSKWGSVKYMVIHLLQTNFQCIPLHFFPFIITMISSEFKQEPMEINRYTKIVDLIQERFNRVFLEVQKEEVVQDQYRFVFYHDFVRELVEIYGMNGLGKNQYAITLLKFIVEKYISKSLNNVSQAITNCNSIYRAFPASGQTEDGENCKLVLLRHIIKIVEGNKQLQEALMNYKESQYLCYSILTHYFHLSYQQLPWSHSEGFTFLPQTKLQAPVLPDLFWKLYKANAAYINGFSILNSTIKNCYPDHYIQTTSQTLDPLQPSIQSQMNIRVFDSLSRLKIPFTIQPFLQGRYIDFCLQGKIILQVDGMFHFFPRELTTNQRTNYRNMHLLLSGYRIITLSIYEYNVCRETEDLMHLISQKIEILNSGAIFVQ